jgi:NAD(P)-dependent dehydrogenase (short-subunit alcohol dehydrogenase family)
MSEKVVIVTGGSRGIGAAAALRLAEPGTTVLLTYVSSPDRAGQVVAGIEARGGRAVAVQADVASEADCLKTFEEADRLGRLTGLVNNAGVVDVATRLTDMSVERFRRIFDGNVLGTMVCAREAVRRMSTAHGGKGGAIVNLSSASAKIGSPSQYIDYAAAKGAVDTFTVGLAKEVAREGIRVNAVRPGIIETEIHASGGDPDRAARMAAELPMGRAGTAEECAEAVAWLLSDAASYTSGAILDVSGARAILP